jgi:uncharacterized membrane protein (DUF106 family)
MVSGFQVIIDTVFNPIFGWMLNIPPLVAILILALVLGLVSTLLQKYLTDQAKLRRLRDDTKKFQEQMKKASKEKDQDKVMKIQAKMMPLQLDMMKETFKPLLVSLVPFLLVFFWLSNHFAFHQIGPEQPFTVSATFEGIQGEVTLKATPELTIEKPTQEIKDGKVTWLLQGDKGTYDLTIAFPEGGVAIPPANRKLIISEERLYETPAIPNPDGHKFVTSFNVENEKLIPIPALNLFGWHPGWIFYYILFSIPLSLLLKKLLQVV